MEAENDELVGKLKALKRVDKLQQQMEDENDELVGKLKALK